MINRNQPAEAIEPLFWRVGRSLMQAMQHFPVVVAIALAAHPHVLDKGMLTRPASVMIAPTKPIKKKPGISAVDLAEQNLVSMKPVIDKVSQFKGLAPGYLYIVYQHETRVGIVPEQPVDADGMRLTGATGPFQLTEQTRDYFIQKILKDKPSMAFLNKNAPDVAAYLIYPPTTPNAMTLANVLQDNPDQAQIVDALCAAMKLLTVMDKIKAHTPASLSGYVQENYGGLVLMGYVFGEKHIPYLITAKRDVRIHALIPAVPLQNNRINPALTVSQVLGLYKEQFFRYLDSTRPFEQTGQIVALANPILAEAAKLAPPPFLPKGLRFATAAHRPVKQARSIQTRPAPTS